MNLKEMIERLNAISTRLGQFGEKYKKGEALSTDEESEMDKLLAEFNDLGPKVEQYGALEKTRKAAADAAERYGQSAGRVAGSESLAGTEQQGQGGRTIDRRGPGQRFAESEAVKNWLANGGKSSDRVSLAGIKGDGITTYDGDGPIDRYALVATGTPAYLVPPMVVPGIQRPRDYALTARDVLVNGRTTSDTIYFLRELLFTNAAAETAQATASGGSSGTKPESSLTFEQASAPVVTIAHWIPITRQAINDAAQLQSYVENRLLVGLERRFNSQVWNGAGGGTNLTGIINTSGVQALNDAYFVGLPTENDGTDNENFERVLRAATEIELTGDAQMTFAAMNPRDLEHFRTVSTSQGEYIAGNPFDANPVARLWGYPIASDRGITAGTVVCGDGTMAAIWDREDANILIDTINDQFVRNMLTILAEMRAALTVFRPAGFALVTLKSW